MANRVFLVKQCYISSDLKCFKGHSALAGMPSLQTMELGLTLLLRDKETLLTTIPVGCGSQLRHPSLKQSSQARWGTPSKTAAAATAAAATEATATTTATSTGSFRFCRRKETLSSLCMKTAPEYSLSPSTQ